MRDATLTVYERSLFARVESQRSKYALNDLMGDNLRIISEKGIDFATALLYQRLRESMPHAEFIRRVDDRFGATHKPIDLGARLVIVPGAFYREFKHSGADGQILKQKAQELGIAVDVIPLKSFGSLDENATLIAEYVRQNRDEAMVIVSLSKGSSDLKSLLARPDAAKLFGTVRTWISLSGIIYGTPIIGWVLSSKLRSWWIRFLLSMRGYEFDVVRNLDHGPHARLSAELQFPEHMQLIHVVGFSLERHLSSRLAKRAYRRIQQLGPNDGGGTLLADVLRYPGLVYPVWGSDHYLQAEGRGMQDLTHALLLYLTNSSTVTESQYIATGAAS